MLDLYIIIKDDRPLVGGGGEILYYPSIFDAACTADESGGEVVSVRDRQAIKDPK